MTGRETMAQDFALAAKSVRMYKFGRKRICPRRRRFGMADSLTGKPQAGLSTENGRRTDYGNWKYF